MKKQLEGYLEHLESKYGSSSLPSWANAGRKIATKQQEKEMNRVAKRIHDLSYCKRHTGREGVNCFACKMEGVLNR